MLEWADIPCPYCGEHNHIPVDCSTGCHDTIHDCEVCCHPMLLRVRVGAGLQLEQVIALRENE